MADPPLPSGATLLVDLDGVVCRQLPPVCTYLSDEYGIDLDPADIDHWTFPIPDADRHIGEIIDELMADRTEWFLSGMDPMPGVSDALAGLREEYRIEIATHRPPETHDVSMAWLAEHDVAYDDFHELVPADKGALPGDALVDDYHGNVANAIAAGKLGVLMRQPYSDPSACGDAHVVETWDDVRRLFL